MADDNEELGKSVDELNDTLKESNKSFSEMYKFYKEISLRSGSKALPGGSHLSDNKFTKPALDALKKQEQVLDEFNKSSVGKIVKAASLINKVVTGEVFSEKLFKASSVAGTFYGDKLGKKAVDRARYENFKPGSSPLPPDVKGFGSNKSSSKRASKISGRIGSLEDRISIEYYEGFSKQMERAEVALKNHLAKVKTLYGNSKKDKIAMEKELDLVRTLYSIRIETLRNKQIRKDKREAEKIAKKELAAQKKATKIYQTAMQKRRKLIEDNNKFEFDKKLAVIKGVTKLNIESSKEEKDQHNASMEGLKKEISLYTQYSKEGILNINNRKSLLKGLIDLQFKGLIEVAEEKNRIVKEEKDAFEKSEKERKKSEKDAEKERLRVEKERKKANFNRIRSEQSSYNREIDNIKNLHEVEKISVQDMNLRLKKVFTQKIIDYEKDLEAFEGTVRQKIALEKGLSDSRIQLSKINNNEIEVLNKLTTDGFNAVIKGVSLLDNEMGSTLKKAFDIGTNAAAVFSGKLEKIPELAIQVLSAVKDVANARKDILDKTESITKARKESISMLNKEILEGNLKFANDVKSKQIIVGQQFDEEMKSVELSVNEKIKSLQAEIKDSGSGLGGFYNTMKHFFTGTMDEKGKLVTDAYKTIEELEGFLKAKRSQLEKEKKESLENIAKIEKAHLEKLKIALIQNQSELLDEQHENAKKANQERWRDGEISYREYYLNLQKLDQDYNDSKFKMDQEFAKRKVLLIESEALQLKENFKIELRDLDRQHRLGVLKEKEYLVELAILNKKYHKNIVTNLNALETEKNKHAQKLLDIMLKPIQTKYKTEMAALELTMRPLEEKIRGIEKVITGINRKYDDLVRNVKGASTTEFDVKKGEFKSTTEGGFYGQSEGGFSVDVSARKSEIERLRRRGVSRGGISDIEAAERLKQLALEQNVFYERIAENIKKVQGESTTFFEYTDRANESFIEYTELYASQIELQREEELRGKEETLIDNQNKLEDQKVIANDLEVANKTAINNITSKFKNDAGEWKDSAIAAMTAPETGAFSVILNEWNKVSAQINSSLSNAKKEVKDIYKFGSEYIAPESTGKDAPSVGDRNIGLLVQKMNLESRALSRKRRAQSESERQINLFQDMGSAVGSKLSSINNMKSAGSAVANMFSSLLQKKAKGGMVEGRNSLVLMNEKGKEGVVTQDHMETGNKFFDFFENPPSINNKTFGSKSVYVNISGNKISNDMDLDVLAEKVTKSVTVAMKDDYQGEYN